MKTAAEFRAIARDALRGRWGLAVITGLVAVLLGGSVRDTPTVNWQVNASELSADLNVAGQTIFSTGALFDSWTIGMLRGLAVFLLLLTLFFLVLGSVVGVGWWIAGSRPLGICSSIFPTGATPSSRGF